MFKRSLCKMWFNVKRQIVITPPVVEKPKEKVQEFSYFLVRSE